MHRKRLLGTCTVGLLVLSAGPAAAGQSVQVQVPGLDTVVVDVADAPLSVRKAADPIIDEGIDGVGHLVVDPNADDMSLTVGIKIDPLGIDETITLGGSGGDAEGEAPTAPAAETEAAEVEQAEQVERIELEKDKAAAQAAASRTSAPAFSSGRAVEALSGEVTTGSGVTSSVRPVAAPAVAGTSATPQLPAAAQNAWLQLMGVFVLAGTSTAWSIAKRQGLA